MNRRIISILFVTLFLSLLGNLLYFKTTNTISNELEEIHYDNIESIIEYGEHMAIGAHYPVLKIAILMLKF